MPSSRVHRQTRSEKCLYGMGPKQPGLDAYLLRTLCGACYCNPCVDITFKERSVLKVSVIHFVSLPTCGHLQGATGKCRWLVTDLIPKPQYFLSLSSLDI
ncbi:hypothetical protein AcV5_001717 [Taiwanofungus camphoratus]|nr:hypothetical protein AcV5_001717 [Antrodia cinnamomea]